MSDDAKIEEILTLERFIKDLQAFPQESEVVGCLDMVGMTIPVVRAISFTTEEGKKLTIVMMSTSATIKALEHANKNNDNTNNNETH